MQKTFFLAAILSLVFAFQAPAQQPQQGGAPGGGQGFDPSKMNVGRMYGKVVDERGAGVGYATVQLFGKKFDPETKEMKDTLLAGQFTENNGDFNLEKLPVMGEFELVISFIGYTEIRRTVSFDAQAPKKGAKPIQGQNGGFSGTGGGNFEKDLGNIRLVEDTEVLSEVTVTAQASTTTLALDRKTFRVDKDLTAAGGTAQDALKNIPSLSVDLDGNVSLRNGSPQVFVDGRPTTLSLDQISADLIESVEVITNPSARFDAGGGTAGIVNIVLKKERKVGYNGNLRAGTDSRGGVNFGGDLNARGNKINLFGSAMYNQRKGRGEGTTLRENFFGEPPSNVIQNSKTDMKGLFANVRAGVDYFMDNRNTLTLSGMAMRGKFQPGDELTTTTNLLYPGNTLSSRYIRTTNNNRNFRNMGGSLQYKHLFPKKGAEWTADLNYNQVRFEGGSNFTSTYDNGLLKREKQDGLGKGSFLTLQADFINPITAKTKLEGGIKATMRKNRNDNTSSEFNDEKDIWEPVPQISDHYKYNDDVYAAYLQGSRQSGAWGFQAGLRAESSFYRGELTDQDSSFQINYPISLFPSMFLTRTVSSDGDQVQLAYTRRVNRPNFWQTMPFTDFSDSLNLRRGNPQLLPEFTNSLELSYQNIFSKGHNLLVSVYYKQATNLIAAYQFTEFNEDLNREIVVTSFANGNSASAYGAEITVKNTFFGWLDLTHNLNLFQASVDATNVENELKVSRTSAYLKETVQLRLPAGLSLQLNGEYRTKASFTPSTGGNSFHGGGPSGQNTAQGYTKPWWFVDVSIKKDLMKNQASLTLSVQDVFKSREFGSFTATDFFTQETSRLMNPQLIRLNFAYRFGKMDTSLFTRKNTRMNMEGNDMMQ